MYGALLGDLIGSPWEFNRIKHDRFDIFSAQCAFTDDSIMTVAVADSLLHNLDPASSMRAWAQRVKPQRGGYGAIFWVWLNNPDDEPYGSAGNGGAMRVSAAAMLGDTLDDMVAIDQQQPSGPRLIKAVGQRTQLTVTNQIARERQDNIKTGDGAALCQGR